jgi:signal transduction histidine kinase
MVKNSGERGVGDWMNRYIDKITVFLLCVVFYAQVHFNFYIVVPIICIIIVSAFQSYVDNNIIRFIVVVLYCAISVFYPVFLFFLPLACYDLFMTKWQPGLLIALIPTAAGFQTMPIASCVFISLLTALSYLIKRRTILLEKVRAEYIALRDSTKEFSLRLEGKNKELMEKQDYEINLATLNERNRIARDIHDSIGHLLSNSILQTGALMATCRDDALRERISTLKNTLVTGMDSIRESIHDLHDESVDLYAEVKALTEGFQFCEITLEYDMDSSPERKVKYTVLSVVKEALSNIIRHSDATFVKLTLREHPALYQLIVKDNGHKKETEGDGIGLKNITQRVESLGGIVNISYDSGFAVFVSIPKEAAK